MLQVVGYIPVTIINNFLTLEFLGIYANYEVLSAQVLLILVLIVLNLFFKKHKK